MSRAYRIKIRESVRQINRASDHISSELELLEILPADETAEILAEEFEKRGFKRNGDTVVREKDGVVVSVDLKSGQVKVATEDSQEVQIDEELTGHVYEENRKSGEEALRDNLRAKLKADADVKQQELQKEVTDRLEAELGDITKELDQVVNRATAEALKRKAAQIGQIKEMTDDPESGSLTIVVEV